VVNALDQLLAPLVTPANEQDRAPGAAGGPRTTDNRGKQPEVRQ